MIVLYLLSLSNTKKRKCSYLSTIGYTESALNGMRVEISIDFFLFSFNLTTFSSPAVSHHVYVGSLSILFILHLFSRPFSIVFINNI